MLQSHYSLFDSFFAPQRILVVSEERLRAAELEARQNQLKALDTQIETLTSARSSLIKEIEEMTPTKPTKKVAAAKKAGKDLDALDGVINDV